jgi:hypothetical protein
MFLRIVGAALVLPLIAAAPAAADVLTFNGLGPVRLGMTESQAIGTGAMAEDRALCPSRFTADFLPAFDARTVWSRKGRVIGIQARSAKRGIERGSSARTFREAYPNARTVGRDVYLDKPVYAVRRNGHSLQFVLAKGKVQRITLTTGWVSDGTEWTC